MSRGKKEFRFSAKLQTRAKASGAKTIGGYAAMFNSLSDNLGGFVEVIRPGAFKRTLAEGADVRCLFNHNEDLVLGRSTAGTLRLWEDEVGLQFECDLPNTTVANDLYESIQRKDVDQCSFGFYVDDDGDNWTPTQDAPGVLRELLDVDLVDASVVTYPAYAATSVGTRAMFPEGMEHVEARMKSFREAGNPSTDHLGAVPFASYDARSDGSYNSDDEANGIISWADGEDEDRSADSPVKNKLKAAQGFLYVKNAGEKRSDYIGPHHTIVDGELAHSLVGTLKAMRNFGSGKLDIPAEHRAAAKQHLDSEWNIWAGDGGENEDGSDDDAETEIERSDKRRLRLAIAMLS
jgi:HK97 family phage prohead protease